MSNSRDRLYGLLPGIYRQLDVQVGGPLHALLNVITDEVDVIDADIAQLYDNWFIETCEEWVVPYIGDLIGYGLPMAGDESARSSVDRLHKLIPRADVANTIYYRRRKGTLALLELLSRDVAGWPGRVVEFGRLVAGTQFINRVNLTRGQTINLRDGKALDLLHGPFDLHSRTADVRRQADAQTIGRYNPQAVRLFVWRLKSYSVTQTPAYCVEEVGDHCYTFSILGNDTQLYTNPVLETSPTQIAGELNVPGPIRARAFEHPPHKESSDFMQAHPDYYGLHKSVVIWAQWEKHTLARPIPSQKVIPADLSRWRFRTPAGHVAIDVQEGRIAFPSHQLPEQVLVSYFYGFSADVGGGEYDRVISDPSADFLSVIRPEDFQDFSGFLVKLKESGDSLSQRLLKQLPPATVERLTKDSTSSQDTSFMKVFLNDLNGLILTDSLLEHPQDDKREQSTQIISPKDALSELPVRSSRLELERAYPNELVKSFRSYLVGAHELFKTVHDALEQWSTDGPRYGLIEVKESGLYEEPIILQLKQDQHLTIRAANAKRPVIRLVDTRANRPDALKVNAAPGSTLSLDGLLLSGRGIEIKGEPVSIKIRHSTLVPGWTTRAESESARFVQASLELDPRVQQVLVERSIVGQITVLDEERATRPTLLVIIDSIVDATKSDRVAVGGVDGRTAHATMRIRNTTVLGQMQVHAVELAENSIFSGVIHVDRRQRGCMRFCYVPPASRTPSRYSCQPDLSTSGLSNDEKEAAELEVRPQFVSVHYGTANYCQLSQFCAKAIQQGAEDESEMGVFHYLYQPQRSSNLERRLQEYVPAETNISIVYVN